MPPRYQNNSDGTFEIYEVQRATTDVKIAVIKPYTNGLLPLNANPSANFFTTTASTIAPIRRPPTNARKTTGDKF